ncbi:sulfur carrier protein ThiS [Rheinheimera sp.]|uniref:sulfur carrier protein ThiS n=1 Tax=Rheinheimera sp. TaxID=1869214 RepID=UPI002FDE6C71
MHGHQMMQLTVNQQAFVIEAKATVAALLTAWSGQSDEQLKVAVALNQRVLTRKEWSTQQLEPKDELLIFNLVAGG